MNEILEKKDYQKTQLIANELISAGDPIYKLITDETWSLIIETDAERADYLLEEEYVQVKFLKDQTVSWAEILLVDSMMYSVSPIWRLVTRTGFSCM